MKHLLHWKDWADDDVKAILELASKLKKERFDHAEVLKHKTLLMLFQKTSTRTRVSFEAGMTELGGHAIFLNWSASNFELTRIEYETEYLSRNAAIIMSRLIDHKDVVKMANSSLVPVINGCCNLYHPCQAMADMLTILEDRGSVKGARLAYVGVHNNVSNSLMAICAALGVHLTLVCPLSPVDVVDNVSMKKLEKKGLLSQTLDVKEAASSVDYIYTDTWVDMEYFNNPDFKKMKEERIKLMLPYQLNTELLKGLDVKIMHDMPIHPGYEISEDLTHDLRSLIFTQAENRLHAQKAIMLTLLESQPSVG